MTGWVVTMTGDKLSFGREIRKCSSGKRRFLDKVSCEARIKLNGKAGKIFAYHCPECDQWHMTSKPQP